MALIGTVIAIMLQVSIALLLIRMVFSWVPVLNPRFAPKGLVLVIFELVYSITDPPIKLAQRLLPAGPSIGGVRFDLGFMVVFFALILLQRIVAAIFFR